MAERRPDIEAAARVKAKGIRFGGTKRRPAPGDERHNLPDEVKPGVTYRDVEISWHRTERVEARIDPRVRERMEEDA